MKKQVLKHRQQNTKIAIFSATMSCLIFTQLSLNGRYLCTSWLNGYIRVRLTYSCALVSCWYFYVGDFPYWLFCERRKHARRHWHQHVVKLSSTQGWSAGILFLSCVFQLLIHYSLVGVLSIVSNSMKWKWKILSLALHFSASICHAYIHISSRLWISFTHLHF